MLQLRELGHSFEVVQYHATPCRLLTKRQLSPKPATPLASSPLAPPPRCLLAFQDAFDSRPLVDLLSGQGLNQHLRDVVIHGIAMCDDPQPPSAPQPAPTPTPQQTGTTPEPPATAPAEPQQKQQQQQQPEQRQQQEGSGCSGDGPSGSCASSSGSDGNDCGGGDSRGRGGGSAGGSGSSSVGGRQVLTASEALERLRVYTESLGRYGGRGAFMAPCYGSGALLEGFVRLAAVKGAISVLRLGVSGLVVEEGAGREEVVEEGAVESVASGGACSGGSGGGEEGAAVGRAAGGGGGGRCRGVVLQTGQVVESNWVVGGPELGAACRAAGWEGLTALSRCAGGSGCYAANSGYGASSSGGGGGGDAAAGVGCGAPSSGACGGSGGAAHCVARAVVLLDGPLREDEGSLLLVIPPGSLTGDDGTGGSCHAGTDGSGQRYAAESNACVIRGLQLGPAMQVMSPGKYLLYLTASYPERQITVSEVEGQARSWQAEAAEQLLRPAVEALVDTGRLRAVTFSGGGGEEEVGRGNGGAKGEEAVAGRRLPKALAVAYYTQRVDTWPWNAAGAGAAAAGLSAAGVAAAGPSAAGAATAGPSAAGAAAPVAAAERAESSKRGEGAAAGTAAGGAAGSPSGVGVGGGGASSSSGNSEGAVVVCPGPDGGLIGYGAVLASTEMLYRRNFPGVPWHTDQVPAALPPGGIGKEAGGRQGEEREGEGGREGGGGDDEEGEEGVPGAGGEEGEEDEEDEAIEELQAALLELGMALPGAEGGEG